MLASSGLKRGYTLIELLVVVGLIALLAGGLGFALGDAGGNALATAQTTLSTTVGLARAQAAVNQTEAIIAIHNTPPPAGDADRYLRLIQVFRSETPGASPQTARYTPVGNPVLLPRGVCIVPNTTAGFLAPGVTWQANPPLISTVTQASIAAQPPGTPFGTGNTAALIMEFKPDGTITQVGTQSHARLVVATITRGANNRPQFVSQDAVRGILIRASGAVTFANDKNGF